MRPERFTQIEEESLPSLQKANGSQSKRRDTKQVARELGGDDGAVARVVDEDELANSAGYAKSSEDDEEAPAGSDGSHALAEAEDKRQHQGREEGDDLEDGNAVAVCEGHTGQAVSVLDLDD